MMHRFLVPLLLAAFANTCGYDRQDRQAAGQSARSAASANVADARALAARGKGSRLTPSDVPPTADENVTAPEPDPIHVTPLDGADPPVFVLRGGPRGPERLVFLHGMCGHGLGYAQSFQFSAAKKGTLIAPQGDVPCGKGPWAAWSGDLAALDQRIVEAFRALGDAGPVKDVAIIGYSQGATRAESLAREYPERYSRLISIGAPQKPSSVRLEHLRAAVMMAGERDRQDLMKAGARSFEAAGIPATYMMIPEATHGAMGPTPELTMGAALDWLWENSR
jgi:predicted esterase